MKHFEGFVFDIDNTAVPEGSLRVTSNSLLSAFRSLDESVIAMAATARTVEFAQPITSELGLRHDSIVANGAQVMNSRSGEVVLEHKLSCEQVEDLIHLSRKYAPDAHCCIAGDPIDSFYIAAEQRARESPGLYLLDLSLETAESYLEEVLATQEVSAYISTSTVCGELMCDVNVGSIEADKGRALKRLLAKHAIQPSKMVAIGDGINDISLLRAAGYRVAMADSHPELLAIADEIVPSQSEDGLLEIVTRFL